MKILILGRNGQLAQDLIKISSRDSSLQVNNFGQKEVDFIDTNKFRDYLEKYYDVDILINCTSYNLVDQAESDKDNAFKLNRDAVREMAEFCRKNNILLIHFSTNYVFDGQNPNPNKETDESFISPLGVYGLSKLAGEQEVQKSNCKFLIFRLSTVFRENTNNFVTKVLQLFAQRDELQIVNDQISNPTYSPDAALAIYKVVKSYQKERSLAENYNKIYHLANQGPVSFYDFAIYILQEAVKSDKLSIKTNKISPVNSSQFKTEAQRPKNGSFELSLFEKTFNLQLPTWQDAIKRIIKSYEQ